MPSPGKQAYRQQIEHKHTLTSKTNCNRKKERKKERERERKKERKRERNKDPRFDSVVWVAE